MTGQGDVSRRPPARLRGARNALEIALLWTIGDPLGDADLTARQRDARLVLDVDASVQNGGLDGLIENPSGNEVAAASAAARRLGLVDVADLLDQVIGRFPDGYPTDLDERAQRMEDLSDDDWDALERLTDDWPEEGVRVALAVVIEQHPDDFWTEHDDPVREAEHLFTLISDLIGEALSGDPVAVAALEDIAAWAQAHGTDDDRRHVDAELQRLASLRT